MTSEVLKNIFVPFYTTKATGQGTGLGLSISHRIVNDHGGRLSATSDGPASSAGARINIMISGPGRFAVGGRGPSASRQ
jgi:C4-dicarboxylate-specific signal transduction histidine kinase